MGALFLNCSSFPPRKVFNKCDINNNNKKKNCTSFVHCQGSGSSSSGKAIKTGGVSSVVRERSKMVKGVADCSAALMDTGSLIVSPNPNGNTQQADIAVKDLVVPYGGSTSLVELQEGIGIVKFLRGKELFITGSTGFLAKVLIEKILRTVPDVGKIFVLVKAKSKEAAMERLKTEIINSELFKCLQQTHGNSYQSFMMSKLVPVVGNVSESDLGLDDDLAELIAQEVDIIVNSAANTNFVERYDVAMDINTRGACHLMSLAKKCKKLKLFLQVSTAYVNGQRQGRVMEKAFDIGDCIARENLISETTPRSIPDLDIEEEFVLARETKEGCHESEVTQKMKELGLERARKYGWQDTYVFTKAMGEMMINSTRGEIPLVIMRPSVIESTCKEPFPGWMEGNRMMDPIVLNYGKGQLTGFLVDPNGVLDVVPADMVVNATLAAIARHGLTPKPDINIYHIASSVVNPLVFQDLARMLHEHYNSYPMLDKNGTPIHVPSMKLFSSMEDFSAHVWKTSAEARSGMQEARCKKSVEQAQYMANIYEPYTFYGGRFDNSNTKRLQETMSEEEKMSFGFDVESIDWKYYIKNVHIPGLRKHVMKGRGTCSSPIS